MQRLPTSQVGEASFHRKVNSVETSKVRSSSHALTRGLGLKMDNQNENENKIRFLNQRVIELALEIEEVCQRVFKSGVSRLHQSDCSEAKIKDYREIWNKFKKLILLLRLYKPLVGLSVIFAKGSPVYAKLHLLVSLGNNLVESIAVSKPKGYLFVKIWDLTNDIYYEFLREL